MPTINHGAAFTGAGASFRSTTSYTNGVYILNERAIKKMDEDFAKKSYTNSAANLSNFSWANANAITIESEGKGQINAYDFGAALGSRMGALHEVNTERNTYQLKQVFSARETFEKIYSDDALNERKLARTLKTINEKLMVAVDTYRLKTWADGAGNTFVVTSGGLAINNASATAAALGTSNIVKILLQANAYLDNMNVPENGRLFFVSITDAYTIFQLADELKYQQEFTNKGAINGAIRRLGKATVVAIPDSRMPAGCKVLCKWKGASADPRKMTWTKIYPNVEGFSGPILNGIWRYDSFILAHKANGVLVIGDSTAAPQTTPAMALGTSGDAGKIVITSASADKIFYTIDGHNPKIEDNGSSVVLGGTATSGAVKLTNPTADCYIQAYAVKAGKVNSGIAKYFYKYDASTPTLTALTYDQDIEF